MRNGTLLWRRACQIAQDSTAWSRHFASSAELKTGLPKKTCPNYRIYPFVHENVEEVIQQVPEFKYYQFQNDNSSDNIYANIPMDQPIVDHMPVDITPPNSEMQFSKLENGLRIASVDKGGLTASLGLFVHAGTRFENHSNHGVSHMIETMAYHSTAHLSWLRTIKTIESLGATATCNAGREHIVYSAECLRKFMPIMIPLLTGNVLFPRLLPWEIKDNSHRLLEACKKLDKNVDACVTEMLHTTAWQNNTLGNKLLATEKSSAYFNADTIRSFMLDYFSPSRMVFVGVNVEHDELCKWLMRSFVDYNAIPNKSHTDAKPVYTGGMSRMEASSPLAHLAIAFETENGWNSEDLMALTLLQSIMGGGGSFSTGGPGKGMYTRLFLNVLNRNEWVDSCMAFNTLYTDSGLFGLYMTAHPHQGANMVNVMVKELDKMRFVTKEEMDRARNALKCSVWMNLECRPIILEDVARQVLMNDKFYTGKDFCDAFDTVKVSDVQRVATKLLSKRPTIVAYGDVSTIPAYDDIVKALSITSSK